MPGLPPLHYALFPSNSPKNHLQEKFHEENHFEDGSVVTPFLERLEGDNFLDGFVLPANPPFTNPFGFLLLQINYVGEPELGIDYPHLPLVPCEGVVSMETR